MDFNIAIRFTHTTSQMLRGIAFLALNMILLISMPVAAGDASAKSTTKFELGANPTKSEFSSAIQSSLLDDSEVSSNPIKKELFTCLANSITNHVYHDKNVLEKRVVESRLEKLYSNESLINLFSLKCFSNSKEVENQIIKNSGNKLPLMDIDDLRVDINSLEGKRVRVKGTGRYLMDSFFLRKSETDLNSIVVDITKLPRDQRRNILSQCTDIMSACKLTITGTIGKASYRNLLIAENVEW